MKKISIILLLTVYGMLFSNSGWHAPESALGASLVNCSGCHGNPPFDGTRAAGTTGLFLGSHNEHTGATTYKQACTVCHYDNGTYPAGATHSNGFINISGSKVRGSSYSLTKKKAVTYSPAFGTCTNVTCHGNGRTDKPQYATSPTWGGSQTTCLSCHGGRDAALGNYAASTGGGFRLSSSHQQHLKYPAANINCNLCHSKTVSDAATLILYSSSYIKHVNSVKDVTFTNPVYGSYTAYKGSRDLNKCGNVSCHGGKSRNGWSTTSVNTNNTCVHCHGVDATAAALANSGDNRRLFAPGWANTGISTDGNSVSSDVKVGAHFVHLSSVYMKKRIRCNECHYVPTTPFDGTTHMGSQSRYNSDSLKFTQASTATITIGVGAAATPTILGSFTGYTSGTSSTKAATCSSVYCHGNRLKNNITSGTYRKPSWNLDLTATPATATSCARCHGFPPTDGSLHTGTDTTCNLCHSHVTGGANPVSFINKALHINGKVESSSDCLGCHAASKSKNLGTAGTIRQVVGAGGDFVRLSRHVSNGTATEIVTKWDCVICHMEGDTTAADRVNGVHNDASGLVNLRNVDSPASGWAINNKSMNETMRTDMDTFCLGCHDSNGASGITVNGTNTGFTTTAVTRNLTPWNTNDNLKNGRDLITTVQRTRVVDVKTQFYAGTYTWAGSSSAMPAGFTGANYNGNPSQHAVLGPRYFTNHASWTAAAWTTHTLRNGQVMNSIREKARLHCSDCHLSESNAHGSTNSWYMLLNGTAGDYTSDTVQTGGAATSAANTCLKCHASFYAGTANAASRWNHSLDSGRTVSNWGAFSYLGSNCTLCHGGNNAVGTIHGTNSSTETYTNAAGTFTRYRFLPGTWMRAQPGGGTDDATAWTGTGTGNCYFGGSSSGSAETMSACGSHAGTGSKAGTAAGYGRAVKY